MGSNATLTPYMVGMWAVSAKIKCLQFIFECMRHHLFLLFIYYEMHTLAI